MHLRWDAYQQKLANKILNYVPIDSYVCWSMCAGLLASLDKDMQMPSLGRMFAGDEELGKKDDDHRPGRDGLLPSAWPARKATPRARGRSVLYGLLACIIIYLFIHNIPTDLGPITQRPDYRVPTRGGLRPATLEDPTPKSPKPEIQSPADKHYYDGPIKFYKLATSLHAVARLIGHSGVNKNVLFAASNLKSAAEIIPIACEMARWERNDVHFAFMGRDDLPVEEIRLINGVTEECKINWHGMSSKENHGLV